jgi:hypothetical protein
LTNACPSLSMHNGRRACSRFRHRIPGRGDEDS